MHPPPPIPILFFCILQSASLFLTQHYLFSLRKCLAFDCISGQLFSGSHSNTYHSRPFLLENQKKVELILRVRMFT